MDHPSLIKSIRQAARTSLLGMLVAVALGACATAQVGSAPTPVVHESASQPTDGVAFPRPSIPPPSPQAPQPTPAGPKPSPIPKPSPTPLTGAAMARSVAARYERRLVAGDWRGAWNLLSRVDQNLRGTLADYADERSAFFDNVGGRYVLAKPTHDRAVLRMWTQSAELVRGADLSRAWIVQ